MRRRLLVFLVLSIGCAGPATRASEPAADTPSADARSPADLRCDSLPPSVTLARLGRSVDGYVELEIVRSSEGPAAMDVWATQLTRVDLNGDSLSDYFAALFEVQDAGRAEYFQLCNNVGDCLSQAWVGCDDLVALVLPGSEYRAITAAETVRSLGGLEWRDIETTQRVGGVQEEEIAERGGEPFVTTRARIGDDYQYEPGELAASPTAPPARPR